MDGIEETLKYILPDIIKKSSNSREFILELNKMFKEVYFSKSSVSVSLRQNISNGGVLNSSKKKRVITIYLYNNFDELMNKRSSMWKSNFINKTNELYKKELYGIPSKAFEIFKLKNSLISNKELSSLSKGMSVDIIIKKLSNFTNKELEEFFSQNLDSSLFYAILSQIENSSLDTTELVKILNSVASNNDLW